MADHARVQRRPLRKSAELLHEEGSESRLISADLFRRLERVVRRLTPVQRREGQSVEMLLEHRVRRHAPHGSAVSREGGRRAEHPLAIRQRCGAEPHGFQEAAAGGGECLHECSL